MINLRQLLQDADPLRHESPRLDADRDRLRQAVLRRARVSGGTDVPQRRHRARQPIAAALATAAIVLLILGSFFWMSERTPALAAIRFEVRLAEDRPAPGLVVAHRPDSRLIYLHPDIVVSNDDVALSWVSDDGRGRAGVNVEFLASGAEKMRQATAGHVGRPMAVLIDGRVIMAPTVRSPISDSALISGEFTRAEAERIAEGIGAR